MLILSNHVNLVQQLSLCSGCRAFRDLRQSAEVVIRRTRAFRRHHTRSDRCFGCARCAEDFALPRLLDALQDLTTLARLRIRDTQSRYTKLQLRIVARVLALQLHATVRDRAEPPPLEVFARLKHL